MILDYLGQYIFHSLKIRRAPPKAASVLVIRNDHIGDVVLSLPVLRALRNSGFTRISYLCSHTTAPLLRHSPDIDDLLVQNEGDTIPVLASRINDLRPEVVLNFNSTPFNARLASAVKAPVKVAYAFKMFNIMPFNRYVFIHRRRKGPVHELDFMLGFLKVLGIDKPKYVTKDLLAIPPSAHKQAEQWLAKNHISKQSRMIGVHPGNRHSADNWSPENYVRFISLFRKKMKKNKIIVLLGPLETGFTGILPKQLLRDHGIHCMKNALTLDAWAALIAKMDLLVSSSSGPMHIAGALEIPTLSLFSSRKAQVKEKWHPLNSCWHAADADPHKTIDESVSVEEIANRACGLLTRNLTKQL